MNSSLCDAGDGFDGFYRFGDTCPPLSGHMDTHVTDGRKDCSSGCRGHSKRHRTGHVFTSSRSDELQARLIAN